jgi:F-type H+-transporting ATPase subunit alpha
MKKVAGSLRLDLASFRSLEAFAQLGTDLDTATQRQLDRGKRIVELLKQPQYQPFETFEQVISIYAGTQGFLDDLPLNKVAAFEAGLLKHLRDEFTEILDEMRKSGDLAESTAKKLKDVVANYKAQFVKK